MQINDFILKSIEKKLQNKGVLRIVRIDDLNISNNKDYAIFFKYKDTIFSEWVSFNSNIGDNKEFDLSHICNALLHHIEICKKFIDSDLFKNLIEKRTIWSYMSDWSLANFIFKQLYNFKIIEGQFNCNKLSSLSRNSVFSEVKEMAIKEFTPIMIYNTIMKKHRFFNTEFNISLLQL